MVEVPLDKRRRIGAARATGPTSSSRARQAFSDVNIKQDATTHGEMASTEGSENISVEFTKEEVETLVNEKPKTKKFDLKVVFALEKFSYASIRMLILSLLTG